MIPHWKKIVKHNFLHKKRLARLDRQAVSGYSFGKRRLAYAAISSTVLSMPVLRLLMLRS